MHTITYLLARDANAASPVGQLRCSLDMRPPGSDASMAGVASTSQQFTRVTDVRLWYGCCSAGGADYKHQSMRCVGGGNGGHRIPSHRTAQCTLISCTELNNNTNGTALAVADAFGIVADAALCRWREKTARNAIGVEFLAATRVREKKIPSCLQTRAWGHIRRTEAHGNERWNAPDNR